jgi:hypothetical protein
MGLALCRLSVLVIRLIEYKRLEMTLTGHLPTTRYYGPGMLGVRVKQFPVATPKQLQGWTP